MKNIKKLQRLYLTHAAVALSVGGIIYLLLRENTYLNDLFNIYGPLGSYVDCKIVNILRFYIVDALWGYALVFSLATVLHPIFAAICSAVWGILWEFLQLKGVVSGTFDVFDIYSYLFSAFVALSIICLITKEKQK